MLIAEPKHESGPKELRAIRKLADGMLELSEGLVCLSGCALCGVHDEPSLRRLLDAFGPDRLRVELQRPLLYGDRARNRRLDGLARRLDVPCVATGDVHVVPLKRGLARSSVPSKTAMRGISK